MKNSVTGLAAGVIMALTFGSASAGTARNGSERPERVPEHQMPRPEMSRRCVNVGDGYWACDELTNCHADYDLNQTVCDVIHVYYHWD